MARRQQRPGASSSHRHVSVSASTYAKLKAFCELHGVPVGTVVERRVIDFLDAQPENLLDAKPAVAGTSTEVP